jgi:hypothetical protein
MHEQHFEIIPVPAVRDAAGRADFPSQAQALRLPEKSFALVATVARS